MQKIDKSEVDDSGHDRKSLCRINSSAHGTLCSPSPGWAGEEELQQFGRRGRRPPALTTTTKTRPLNTNFRCSVDHYAIWINKWRMVRRVNRTLKCSGRISIDVRHHVHLNFSSVTSSPRTPNRRRVPANGANYLKFTYRHTQHFNLGSVVGGGR